MLSALPIEDSGDTWLIADKGVLWPCVIWPKVKLHERFRQVPHARDDLPVFVLGRYMFRWCSPLGLKEFVPSVEYIRDDQDAHRGTEEAAVRLRKMAFKEAIEFHPLAHFEDIVKVKLAEQTTRNHSSASKAPYTTQNRTGASGPPFSRSDIKRQDTQDIPATSRSYIKQEVQDYSYDGPTSTTPRTPGTTHKRPIVSMQGFDADEMYVTARPCKRITKVIDLCTDDESENRPPLGSDKARQKQAPRTNFPAVMESVRIKPEPNDDTKSKLGIRSGEDDKEDKNVRKLTSKKAIKSRKRTTMTEGIVNIGRQHDYSPSVEKGAPKTPKFGRVGIREPVVFDGDEDDEVDLTDPSAIAYQTSMSRANSGLGGKAYGGRKAAVKKVDAKKPLNSEDLAAHMQEVRFYMDHESGTKEDGNEVYYVGTMAMVNRYPHFKSHLSMEDGQPCVRSEALDYINQEEFGPIAQFLEDGEYTPKLLEGPYVELDGVRTQLQHEEAALAAGGLWNRAKDMQMIDLMQLIRTKIRAQSPLASNVLIMLANLIWFSPASGLEVEGQMKKAILDEITSRFYELLTKESRILGRLMMNCVDVTAAIGKTLAADPDRAGKADLQEDE